jgi:FMN phosphatase YigB (HAD superfamily)
VAVIDNAGLRPLVDAVCVSAIVGLRKPDPVIFRLAAERYAARTAGNWMMIGDNPADDISGASTAGMRSGWITRGRTWAESHRRPTVLADSFHEAVTKMLAESNAGGR